MTLGQSDFEPMMTLTRGVDGMGGVVMGDGIRRGLRINLCGFDEEFEGGFDEVEAGGMKIIY